MTICFQFQGFKHLYANNSQIMHISLGKIFLLKPRLTCSTISSISSVWSLIEILTLTRQNHSCSSPLPPTASICSLPYLSEFWLPLASCSSQKLWNHSCLLFLSISYPPGNPLTLLPKCIHGLCSFMWWSGRGDHKKGYRKDSEKQGLI